MFNDVIDYRDFYENRLGLMARRMIRRKIREFWPDDIQGTVLGIGYAVPYLRPFLGNTTKQRVIAAMPASMGALKWPRNAKNLVVLTEECDLPFEDSSMNRIIMVHSLENSGNVRQLLREAWRVLAEDGRLLVIVPNRRGIWARFDRTPFGQGHPYSPTQLRELIRNAMFTPHTMRPALYMPPTASPIIFKTAPAWEKLGEKLFKRFSGVLLIEASKQVYALNYLRPKKKTRIQVATPWNT